MLQVIGQLIQKIDKKPLLIGQLYPCLYQDDKENAKISVGYI